MYWLSYEGTLMMGVDTINEIMWVLKRLRESNNKGTVTITWVEL